MKTSFIAAGVLLLLTAYGIPAQNRDTGVTRPISNASFVQDSDVKCLQYAVETGNPDTGPSTHILEFPKGCLFPWHYHTAEEQMMVVQGKISVQMGDGAAVPLGPAGFAMMPSKEPHQFWCVSQEECQVFVHFDRAYDIFWVKKK
jgi:quercetin dioxygenase-like cupin family protein